MEARAAGSSKVIPTHISLSTSRCSESSRYASLQLSYGPRSKSRHEYRPRHSPSRTQVRERESRAGPASCVLYTYCRTTQLRDCRSNGGIGHSFGMYVCMWPNIAFSDGKGPIHHHDHNKSAGIIVSSFSSSDAVNQISTRGWIRVECPKPSRNQRHNHWAQLRPRHH